MFLDQHQSQHAVVDVVIGNRPVDVAAAGLGGVLIKLLTSEEVRNLIWTVLSNAFESLLG